MHGSRAKAWMDRLGCWFEWRGVRLDGCGVPERGTRRGTLSLPRARLSVIDGVYRTVSTNLGHFIFKLSSFSHPSEDIHVHMCSGSVFHSGEIAKDK